GCVRRPTRTTSRWSAASRPAGRWPGAPPRAGRAGRCAWPAAAAGKSWIKAKVSGVGDYGRDVKFGYFLIPQAEAPLLAIAREVERRGLDYIAVQDHPYQRRFVDTWTLLSMIGAVTERVHLFPDVANLPLRPPAVLAKAAA